MSEIEFIRELQEHFVSLACDSVFMSKHCGLMSKSAEYFDEDLSPAVLFACKAFTGKRKPVTKATLKSKFKLKFKLTLSSNTNHDVDAEALTEFTREQRTRVAMHEATELFDGGEGVAALQVLATSLKDSKQEEHQGFNFFKDNGSVQASRGTPIYTKLEALDKATGGVCPGEVALVMSETNGGKTSWLVAMATEAVIDGFNVMYVSLEMPKHGMKLKFQEAFDTRVFKKKKCGELDIVCYPPHHLNVYTLEGLIHNMDVKPDLLVIDSMDLFKQSRARASSWEEEGETAVSIKAMAETCNVRVWISTQSNRGGYSEKIIKTKDVKGSLGKMQIVDQVITLNQSESEAFVDPDKGHCAMRIYLAKNRWGIKAITIFLVVYFGCCVFEDADTIGVS